MGAGERRRWNVAWSSGIVHLLVFREILAVAVTEVRLLSNRNTNQYVLHGEGATLTCHYVLEPAETVTEVEWEKDGTLVYLWSVDSPPEAKDVLKGRVDLSTKSPSTINITQAHMDMQGSYSCRVRTNGRSAQNEAFVTVIVDTCYDNAWTTHSDMITCTEEVKMRCVGMFPKPSPACGVLSEQTGKYLTSVPFESITPLANGTYEISLTIRYNVKDYLNHTDISFSCFIVVLGTNWRRGIKHKLFGDPGCPDEPPVLPNGYYNMTEEKSCWDTPREGARVIYHCDEGFRLRGSALYMCSNGKWRPEGFVVDNALPICATSRAANIFPTLWSIFSLLIAGLVLT